MVFDRNVLAFDVTGFVEAVTECSDIARRGIGRSSTEEADDRCRLLRTPRERPRSHRAAEQRDELAAPHSITSSARASKIGERSKPSALAALRLITNSNLVPCWTGKSAGFAPLRILSTKVADRYHISLRLAEYENRQPASVISRNPQISGRRWRAAASAIAAREAMKIGSSSTKMASAGHARIDAKFGSKSSDPRASKLR